jgi:hypothetical protein
MDVTAIGVPEIESIIVKATAAATEVIQKELGKAQLDSYNRLLVIGSWTTLTEPVLTQLQ